MSEKSYILYLFSIFMLYSCNHSNINATNNQSLKDIAYEKKDSLIYQSYTERYKEDKNISTGDLIIRTASFFLETPYKAATLESSGNEQLIVNLREFDCTTFLESCLAMVKSIQSKNPSFTNYCQILQDIRYRNGTINDYSSRLHYMTDWIYENEHTRLIKNISSEMNGIVSDKNIDFMSSHPDAYAKLKEDPAMQKKIQDIEQIISKRKSYQFIPKENLAAQQHKLRNGDIVLFATTIEGLDYTHAGFITIPENAVPTFIHASSNSAVMKVTIQNESLLDYINKSKSCTGITILRAL